MCLGRITPGTRQNYPVISNSNDFDVSSERKHARKTDYNNKEYQDFVAISRH